MPKQPSLPPRDASGRFVKKDSSSPTKQPSSEPDPPLPESEASSSSSLLLSTNIGSPTATSFVFPKPVRHTIPGSFSPLAESPSESSIPVSTLISLYSKTFVSPFTVPVPDSRTPSPASLPETTVPQSPVQPLGSPPDSPSSSISSSSSSSDSSQTVSIAPRISSKVFPVNFKASQFLSSQPDPFSASSSSQVLSSSVSPSVPLTSIQPPATQFASTSVLPSSTLVITPIVSPPNVPASRSEEHT